MDEAKIYVGLNDSITLTQLYSDEKYISVLKKVCMNYRVPFSFSMSNGGYIHESGEFTQENSLVLTLIGVEETIVDEIAKDLCAFFHHESVLVTHSAVRSKQIKENI